MDSIQIYCDDGDKGYISQKISLFVVKFLYEVISLDHGFREKKIQGTEKI